MLVAGLSRPNVSPFTSPLILVKKKDGSWRFCTYYTALNRITTPNLSLIPVIDELLDELSGHSYFPSMI